jgi:hypothetical protein
MSEVPGFRFTESQAKDLVAILQKSADLLSESAVYATEHCDEDVALPFKHHIARILADLGWDVLEQGFYKKYPNLRPYQIDIER